MSFFIDTSPSNRSVCRSCHRIIKNGERRLIFAYRDGWKNISLKMCAECGKIKLNELINELNIEK